MKKIFGIGVIVATLSLLCINVFAYDYFWFQAVDESNQPITDFTSVTIYTAGTTTTATLYDSRNGTTTDNPITGISDGIVSFWGNKSSYDAKITRTDKINILFSGLTVNTHNFKAVNHPTKRNLVVEKWLAPVATSTTGCTSASIFDTAVIYSNTVAMYIVGATGLCTQPVYARNLTWGCTNPAGIVSSSPGNTIYITVTGIDARGIVVSENILGGTAVLTSSANSGTGSVAFARVDTITFSTGFITGLGHLVVTPPRFYLGFGNKLGLSREIYGDTPVKVVENAANVAVSTVTINEAYSTYTPVATMNGTLNLELWYKAKESALQDK